MIRVRVCSAAETEFTNALCWYAERNPTVALEFDSEFDAVLAKIAESPDRYPTCDDRHRYVLMRRFPYPVIYRTVAGANYGHCGGSHVTRAWVLGRSLTCPQSPKNNAVNVRTGNGLKTSGGGSRQGSS